MDKANGKAMVSVAARMRLTAQGLAPKRSGDLINSIRHFKYGKGRRVIADAQHKGFPYPLWVNAEPGYEVIKAFGKIPAKYGVFPNWRWTGQVQKFWDVAIDETKERFKEIVTPIYKRAVRMK